MEIQNFTTVCRLCLGDTVFLSVLDEGFTSLPQKILACVDVEVRETDKMTKMICKQCFLRIEDWHDFKKSCEQSQFKLQTWANSSPDPTPNFMNVTIKEEEPDDELQIMDNEVMLNIKIEPTECDVDTEYDHLEAPQLSPQFPPDLSDPLMSDSLLVPSSECDVSSHGIEAPPERCRVCSKMFSTMHNRIRHERDLHHLNIDSPRLSNSDIDSVNNINYSDASSDATQMTSVTQVSSVSKISRASRVSRVNKVSREKNSLLPMQTETEFVNYYANMNEMVRTRHCMCCNFKYSTNKKLYQHLRKRMYLEFYACYPCCISFTNISQFKIHSGNKTECYKRAQLIASGQLNCKLYHNYKCNYCMFIFPDENRIKSHMEKKHSAVDLPTSCPICTCVLTNETEFQDHLYSNCIYRVYCGICKKDFPTNEDFEDHTSIHQGTGGNSKKEEELRLLNPASFIKKEQNNCHLCKSTYNNNLSLLKHLRLFHNDTSVYICKICPDNTLSKFMLRSNLTEHMLNCHKDTSIINLDQHNNFSCNTCGSLFTNLNEWKKHQKMHAVKHTCDECSECFDTPAALEKHKSSHKLKLKLYRCSENSYVTSAGRSSRRNSFVNQLMCRICDKYFSTKSELHDHLMLHDTMPRLDNSEAEETGGYQCELCDKNYKFKFSLTKHIKSVHGGKSLTRARAKSQPPETKYQKIPVDQSRICLICDVVLNNSNAYYKHNHKYHSKKHKEKSVSMPQLNIESEDAPEPKKTRLSCDSCNQTFQSAVGLSNHSRWHVRRSEDREINPPKRLKRNSTAKPVYNETILSEAQEFKCISCGEVYPDLESLQQHLLIHITPEMIPDGASARKLYPCIHCLKICITPASLMNHSKIHDLEGMKKAQKKCPTCDKIVANNAALVNHLKSNTCVKMLKKKKKSVCKICSKAFPTHLGLVGHMKQHSVRHAKDVVSKKSINPLVGRRKLREKAVDYNNDDSSKLNCSKCNIEFDNTQELQQHVRVHVREVKQRLNIDQSQDLTEDEIEPQTEKYHCDLCDEFFVSPQSFKSHKGWHKRAGTKQALLAANSPKIKYNCTSCKLSFDSESELHKHQRSHGKKYFCEACNKEYCLVTALRRHMQVAHNMEYQADVSMEIVVPETVKKDTPKPKPEKNSRKSSLPQNYKCTECNTFYPNAKRLRQHVMTHANSTI